MTGHRGGVSPSETKEEISKVQLTEKNKDDGGTPGPACTLSGNYCGLAALRREQWCSWRIIIV
jgi:hypothetical protein